MVLFETPQRTQKQADPAHQQDQDHDQLEGGHVAHAELEARNDAKSQQQDGNNRERPADGVFCVVEDESDAEDQRDQHEPGGEADAADSIEGVAHVKMVGHLNGGEKQVAADDHHRETDEKSADSALGSAGAGDGHGSLHGMRGNGSAPVGFRSRSEKRGCGPPKRTQGPAPVALCSFVAYALGEYNRISTKGFFEQYGFNEKAMGWSVKLFR